MLQLATRAVMQHETYNSREPVVPNVSFTDTKVSLKHIFIIQLNIVAKALVEILPQSQTSVMNDCSTCREIKCRARSLKWRMNFCISH